MKTYKLKLTALTPIHIGTGEVYEPTNFVIDGGYLYEFDEYEFVSKLSRKDKNLLISLSNMPEVYKFFKDRKKLAIDISYNHIKVCRDIETIYRYIEKPRINFRTKEIMLNKNGKPVYNQMNILKTIKAINFNEPIISGSSLKGAIQTFLNLDKSDSQKLIISDSIEIKADTQIGYVLRVHRNPNKKSKGQIPQMIEVITPNSTFEMIVKCKDIDIIKQKSNEFYTNANKYLYESIKSNNIKNDNQFILRVGKYVGKEFMVRQIRKLPVTKSVFSISKRKDSDIVDFGWILCEVI